MDVITKRVWRLLREVPGRYQIDKLAWECHTSKTQVRLALRTLEEEGFIRIEYEED